MMEETGEVIAQSGGTVTVRMKRGAACGKCRACAVGASPEELRVTAANQCGAAVGDRVRVRLQTDAFYKAALILYGVSLVFLLLGLAVGYAAGMAAGLGSYAGLTAIAGGLLLLMAAQQFIRRREPKWRAGAYAPVAHALDRKSP